MTRKASCCCGACCVEVQGDPELNALCHCSNCKRRTGSAFGWSAYFADERVVSRSGDLSAYRIPGTNPGDAGNWLGVTLWREAKAPDALMAF